MSDGQVAAMLRSTLSTPDEQGKKFRDANVTDALFAIALAIEGLTGAVERLGAGEVLAEALRRGA